MDQSLAVMLQQLCYGKISFAVLVPGCRNSFACSDGRCCEGIVSPNPRRIDPSGIKILVRKVEKQLKPKSCQRSCKA